MLDSLREILSDFGAQYPWVIFLAIVVLPGVGCPASILFIIAGAVWPTVPWVSCLLALLALALNVTWTHLLAAAAPLAKAKNLLPVRWRRLLDLQEENHVKVACIMRFTPGIPLFVQNYALGLCGVPLRLSLLIGLPIHALYVCGFILTGGALFEGKVGLGIAGVGLLIAVGLILQILRRRQAIGRGGEG